MTDVSPCDDAVQHAIRVIENAVGDPRRGLPLEVFLLFTRLLPLFTVDVWLQDEQERVLLTWREDEWFGRGWHVPGGALRLRETVAERLRTCAREELGAEIACEESPFALLEEIQPEGTDRTHNVAAAFRCRLLTGPDPARGWDPQQGPPRPGQWAWHRRCPDDLLPVHRVYERFFPRGGAGAEQST
ncbi:MAG: NUDIX hydrolase [Chloroflexi bacterium]|nr:NUDIX hydrolase [Chloroflexota bacterium]